MSLRFSYLTDLIYLLVSLSHTQPFLILRHQSLEGCCQTLPHTTGEETSISWIFNSDEPH